VTRRELIFAGAAMAAQAQTQSGAAVRIGMIGAGHRAWAHIAVLRAIPGFQIAGIADPTPEFLQKAAALAGPAVPLYPDYRRLLAEGKDLHAVLVASPNSFHAEQSMACLQKGLHVLCEKPMAIEMADAARMIDAAERAGKVLQISLQMRCTPIYEKVLELVRAGEIGSLQFVSWNLFRGDWNPASWSVTDPKTGKPVIWRHLAKYTGSSLLEDGIHEIDIVNWISGSRMQRVYAAGGNAVWKDRETLDHASIVADYENGLKLQLGFSLFAAPAGPSERALILIGTQGVIHVEAGKITLRKQGAEPRDVEFPSDEPKSLLQQQIGRDLDIGTYRQALAFLDSIRTGRKPLCDGHAGAEAVRCSLLAEQSVRQRRAVG
jgi:predicted dehydrogenase